MRNNFTNYSQIKFYKNALKLLKKLQATYEKIGEKRGELKKVKNIAISLAQEGESVERIARILGETEKTIKEWMAETH